MVRAKPKQTDGAIDLVFVIDETGSMGSQIQSVRQGVRYIVDTVSRLPHCKSLRYGLVGYRDHEGGSSWASCIRVPLTDDIARMQKGVDAMAPSGGADYPEAVCDGLYELARLGWRPEAAKTAVLIADAPPHGVGGSGDSYPGGCPCGEDWLEQVETCREMGIAIHAVACSGLIETDVWRRIASETYGQYFALADYKLLPELITGVAQCDLDRQRVLGEVSAAVTGTATEALARINSEEDRLSHVLATLLAKGVTVQFKKDANSKVASRPIEKSDVEQAISSLRRAEILGNAAALFPKLGLAPPPNKAGLFSKSGAAVPLRRVEATSKILGFAAEVEIVQTFCNELTDAIEATYKFPVDELAGVTGFVAEVDGKRIVAKCMAKEKAAQVYEDAIASGSGAYLLEQKQGDIFEMSVGNLPPGKTVLIRITYVTQLESEGGAVRFVIPTTIAPRYAMPTNAGGAAREEGVKVDKAPYKISISVTAKLSSPISKVQCPTHTIVTEQIGECTSVRLKEEATEMNADFVLFLYESLPSEAYVLLEEWEDSGKASVNGETPIAAAAVFSPKIMDSYRQTPREVILLLDCSASMIGGPIDKVRDALKEFLVLLPGLPHGSKFNVIAFGSCVRPLFDESQPSDSKAALGKIAVFVDEIEPDLGGSQLLKAISRLQSPNCLCEKGHVLQERYLHELFGENPNYMGGFLCDECKGCEGHPMHCTQCEFDLCRKCTIEAQSKTLERGAKVFCGKQHPLKFAESSQLIAQNKNYSNGFNCDVCLKTYPCSSTQPLHCSVCQYDLCTKCAMAAAPTRAVILITDAAVSQSETIIGFVKKHADDMSFFTIGVGHGVSQALIRGVARVSNGAAEFCTIEEDIKLKFRRQITRIFGGVDAIDVSWPGESKTSPPLFAPLVGGTQLIAFAMIKKPAAAGLVSLKGSYLGKPFLLEVQLDLKAIQKGSLIHRLAARSIIRDLESSDTTDKAKLEKDVIQLATEYSLASKFTSFVAVEERVGAVEGSLVHVDVASQQPKRQAQEQQQARQTTRCAPDFHLMKSECMKSSVPASGGGSSLLGISALRLKESACTPSLRRYVCAKPAMAAPSSCSFLSGPPPPPPPAPMAMGGRTESLRGLAECCEEEAGSFDFFDSKPCEELRPLSPWEALLQECGSSITEIVASPKLAKAIRVAVEKFFKANSLKLEEDGNGGFSITKLSSTQRSELVKCIKKVLSSTKK